MPPRRSNCLTACLLLLFVLSVVTYFRGPDFQYEDGLAKVVEAVASPFHHRGPAYRDEYLAICLAVKDQALDLPEFVQHHYYNMGIRRLYIMDDGSNPPMSDSADLFGVPQEALTFVYYNESQRVPYMQFKIYDDCAHVYGVNHTWIAFIDADEFFDTPGNETLADMLQDFEPMAGVGALGVSWQMHTSNGRQTRAPSVRRAYTECIDDGVDTKGDHSDNKHIKSIVKVLDFGGAINPHKFNLGGDSITVGEHGDPVSHHAFREPITRDRVALHHYAVKSREEYELKIARGNAMSQAKGWDFWNHVEKEMGHVRCTDMVRWVE